MGNNISVWFRDDTKVDFLHEGRAGGSFTKTCEFRDGWLIVKDEWGKYEAYPSDVIKRVVVSGAGGY